MADAKKTTNGIEVYKQNQFQITTQDISALPQLLEANIGAGNDIDEFELDRVSVPSGGGTQWSIPDLSGQPVDVSEIEGVILLHGERRAFWKQSFDETGPGTPPDCSSLDARTGVGYIRGEEPSDDFPPVTRNCKTCPMSQWGSGKPDKENDNSQACNSRKILYLIRHDDVLPLIVDLAPTSIQPINKFMLRLTSRGIPCHGAVVRLKLRKEQSSGGINYSIVEPSLVAKLSPEETASMASVAAAMKPYFDKTGAEGVPAQAVEPTVNGRKPVENTRIAEPSGEPV